MKTSSPPAFAASLLAVAFFVTSPTRGAENETPATANLEAVAKTYAIEIVTDSPRFPVRLSDGEIRGRAADAEKIAAYAELFVREFSRYPVEFVKRSTLRRVVLCEELAWDDQLRAAVPDFAGRTLYLDVSRGAERENYQRKVLHHDYFHMIDNIDDGSLNRDERWAAANPAEFRYGTGGHTAQTTKGTGDLSDDYPGFLNHYSTTAIEEDKAEIFAHLLVSRDRVARRMETDAIVRAKVELMKRLVSEFCPAADENWWKAAETN